jgi:hypothetical protein
VLAEQEGDPLWLEDAEAAAEEFRAAILRLAPDQDYCPRRRDVRPEARKSGYGCCRL